MLARVIIVALCASMVGGLALMALKGVWGESSTVVSTRVGSGGGGYGSAGRVK